MGGIVVSRREVEQCRFNVISGFGEYVFERLGIGSVEGHMKGKETAFIYVRLRVSLVSETSLIANVLLAHGCGERRDVRLGESK
jgi:hypothetical protein